MNHKNDYSAIVFFEDTRPKRWTYVHTLDSFVNMLNEKHPNWEYINLYERRTKQFLKRFYKGTPIPKYA